MLVEKEKQEKKERECLERDALNSHIRYASVEMYALRYRLEL